MVGIKITIDVNKTGKHFKKVENLCINFVYPFNGENILNYIILLENIVVLLQENTEQKTTYI